MTYRVTLLAIALPLAACGDDAPRSDRQAADAPTPAAHMPDASANAVATTTVPQRFRGTFDRDAAACTARASIERLTIAASELRFHESLGAVKSVSADGADAIRIAADYSGEGMAWSTSQRLTLVQGDTRLVVAGEGAPITRVRC